MTDIDEVSRQLGRIEERLVAVAEREERNSERLESIDGRLRAVEKTSAINGSIAGGIVAGAVAIGQAVLRSKIG
jgi:hypothetical protein